MNPIYWSCGCLLISGIAVGIIVLTKKRGQSSPNAQSNNTFKAEAVSEFKTAASVFVGLYEPLHMIKEGRLKHSQPVFADWGERIANIDNAPSLSEYWNNVCAGSGNWSENDAAKKASEILSFASVAGVSRSTQTEVSVSRDTFKYYMSKDGGRLEPGVIAKVELPYWAISNGETVLEKGIITITKESEE
ncbi:MAG: hypothetical protein FWH20_10265 [Oscillospiraceae bacterium]|nr:hypothetical protein [Oscillospiraceae bacterium]